MTALQLPTVLLTFWYGPAVAGLFAFSQTILGAPASLVGQAVAQVFTGEISRAGVDSPGLLPLYQRTSRKLFLIGLLPTLPWLIAGAWLIPLIFGENWRAAGLYVQLLSINFLVQFVSVPISIVLIYINRQGTVLLWDIARILITIACLGLPKYFSKGDLLAIGCFSAAMVICYGALYLLGLFALRKNRQGTIRLDEKGGFPHVSNSSIEL
jgi:O-antigen/teichoic acid export membrane protein